MGSCARLHFEHGVAAVAGAGSWPTTRFFGAQMHLLKFLLTIFVALLLSACAQGSTVSATTMEDTSALAPRIYTPKLASDLVDRSGEVQSVQGINPSKYFVANEIALGAVDADGDGIWDDIMARLKDDPIWNEFDHKLIVQSIIGLQESMQMKSVAAVIDPERKSLLAMGCFYYHHPYHSATYYEKDKKFYKTIESAVFTSKPRVLAHKYQDFLANGKWLPGTKSTAESCR